MNERAVYLHSVFFVFAVLQCFVHIYYDYDSVPLSLARPPRLDATTQEPPSLLTQLRNRLIRELKPLKPLLHFDSNDLVMSILRNVVLRTVCVSLLSPFLYAIFLRRAAWRWSLALAALVWDLPATRLSYIPPYYPSLIFRSLTAGLLLVTLFEASNAVFTAYMAEGPLKKGQPISVESKDPNGSLSTGFRSRKEVVKVWHNIGDTSSPRVLT